MTDVCITLISDLVVNLKADIIAKTSCFQHSKVCMHRLDKTCPVPKCDKIRSKVIEEWAKLKAKHGHLMKIAFLMLSHARLCGNADCREGICCKRMKQVIRHTNVCAKKADCKSKNFLFSLCQQHHEICTDYTCPVDFCQEKFSNVELCSKAEQESSQAVKCCSLTGTRAYSTKVCQKF